MNRVEGENRHKNFKRAVRAIALGVGTAVLLSGAVIRTEGTTPIKAQLVPVPCTEPMPWDPPLIKNNQSGSIEIELASVKSSPTEVPIKPECWTVIQ